MGMRRLLNGLRNWCLPLPRVIPERGTQREYLLRWYLRRRVPGVYLHCAKRPDNDLALHSHPWRWSCALILSGGYTEERLRDGRIISRELRPGSFMWLWSDDYHRIAELRSDESWSLFVTGPRVGAWHFLDRWTGRKCPSDRYIRAREGGFMIPWS